MPRITLEVSEELSQQVAEVGFKPPTTSGTSTSLPIYPRFSRQQPHS
jgi:hypothetical protein